MKGQKSTLSTAQKIVRSLTTEEKDARTDDQHPTLRERQQQCA